MADEAPEVKALSEAAVRTVLQALHEALSDARGPYTRHLLEALRELRALHGRDVHPREIRWRAERVHFPMAAAAEAVARAATSIRTTYYVIPENESERASALAKSPTYLTFEDARAEVARLHEARPGDGAAWTVFEVDWICVEGEWRKLL